jgi:hypothetical protein
MTGYICGPRIYEYKGVTIEMTNIGGPCATKKNGDPYVRMPRRIEIIILEFWGLPDEEQARYRTGSGCQRFGGGE